MIGKLVIRNDKVWGIVVAKGKTLPIWYIKSFKTGKLTNVGPDEIVDYDDFEIIVEVYGLGE